MSDEADTFLSTPIRLTKNDGRTYELGVNEIEDRLMELRIAALDNVYGERVSESKDIKEKALAWLESSQFKRSRLGSMERKVSVVQKPIEDEEEYYTVDLLQRQNEGEGDKTISTELRLRKHSPQFMWKQEPPEYVYLETSEFAGIGFRDEFVVFIDLESSKGFLGDESDICDVRVNLDGDELEEAERVFQNSVMDEIGSELTPGQAMLNSDSVSAGDQMADMFTFGLQPGESIGRRFRSLTRYYDRLMSVGRGRGLREVDKPQVDLVLKILDEGQRNDDRVISRQIDSAITSKYKKS